MTIVLSFSIIASTIQEDDDGEDNLPPVKLIANVSDLMIVRAGKWAMIRIGEIGSFEFLRFGQLLSR